MHLTKTLEKFLTAANKRPPPPPFHRTTTTRTTTDTDKHTDRQPKRTASKTSALYEGWTGAKLTRLHPITTTTIAECDPLSEVEEEVAPSITKATPFTAMGDLTVTGDNGQRLADYL